MSPTSNSTSNEPELPEAYRIGNVPFLGATIYLDSRPLIPRTETEWWTERALTEIQKLESAHVTDLFAGSGCVGVAVLLHAPHAHVTFGELDVQHLPTIEKNLRENGIDQARARIVQSDVWDGIAGTFDFVLANPPYLSRARIDRIQDSVLTHEPETALFAEDDGYALIDTTLRGLPKHLTSTGQCWIEHEPEHAERIITSAAALGLTATVHKDQYGVKRYSVILKP